MICGLFFHRKNRKPELKPPDLWIHHDQMELKGLDKSGHPRSTPITPSVRGSMDFEDPEEKVPLQLQHNTNSLDKSNYLTSYTGMSYVRGDESVLVSLDMAFELCLFLCVMK